MKKNQKQNDTKKLFGQFFTITNPFNVDIFYKWMNLIPEEQKQVILEPFAGANNIVKMISDLNYNYNWNCFDIQPAKNNVVPKYKIIKQDTLQNFPKNYHVAITNPPYLAKNSATRAGLDFPKTDYDDIYKLALDIMLQNVDYVAAIIPESFINSKLFHNRIFAVISLTCKMFEDTDCPVCLSLFIPQNQKQTLKLAENDFFVFIQNKKIGKYQTLKKEKPSSSIQINWKFNDPNGEIGIRCIDDTTTASIEFVKGEKINKNKIKNSSRSITKISGLPKDIDINIFIEKCNLKLNKYREDTSDIFLTSFKGLRKDKKYRRRLDFANAKSIMNSVIEDIRKEKNDTTND